MEETSPTMDLESEQFMTLLTDALRAGPSSPQWQAAVSAVKSARPGATGAALDDYALLIAARESLESGKEYRSVRPGVGFTRKVMENLDAPGRGGLGGFRTANLIAIVSAGIVLLIILAVAFVLMHDSNPTAARIDQLADASFVKDAISTRFDSSGLGPQWKAFGDLPVKAGSGLKPAALSATEPSTHPEMHVGGIVSTRSFAADVAFRAEYTLRVARSGEEGIVQLFISDGPPDATRDKSPATHDASAEIHEKPPGEGSAAPHELVWLLQAGQASVVLPDGTFVATGGKIDPAREVTVNIKINGDVAIVESGGKRLYAGLSHLNATPRYVGVRFVQKPGEKVSQRVAVESMVVKTP